MTAEVDTRYLLISLLQGFYWFDEGLQNYLRARGWPSVTRPQSMIMANVTVGIRNPSVIARRLGVSRQAIHVTIGQMIELGIVELADDPSSRRVKVVVLTPQGENMRRDAQRAMVIMADELGRRTGRTNLARTAQFLNSDWGPPLDFQPEEVRSHS